MSSAIYPDPPRLVTAVCGHGEQQRLSNARLRLTFYNAPVAYCGPARPGSAYQQSAVSGLLPRARARRADSGSVVPLGDKVLDLLYRGPRHAVQQRANVTRRQLIIISLLKPGCRSVLGGKIA